jgi:glucose-6-phosphate isomerase
MNIAYFNSPVPQPFGDVSLPIDVEFLSYTPDFGIMEQLAAKYAGYKKILIIGHGGSITSFQAIYGALESQATKLAYFLSTVDPDDIAWLKQQLSPEDTLVIAISKSGETTTQIEAVSEFLDYPLLFVTGEGTPLAQIAKARGGEIVAHPSVGGRFTAFTEVALLPAALCGFDVKATFAAGRKMHQQFQADNLAWQAASVFAQLEEKGYVDVFLPFYSHSLFGSSNLIVQLCHESFGKDGKGQTYFAHESPESQHHTNQRFLGGRQNMAGFFTSLDHFTSSDSKISIPAELQAIPMKNSTLAALDGIPFENAMHYELEGTLEDAKERGIPAAHLSVERLDPAGIGEYLAFWQLYAVYSSLLRGVNPFDQPAVENSKKISFEKRLKFKI